MDDKSHNKLLEDVLRDDPDFREELLGKTLRQVRRRKQIRVTRNLVAVCLLLASGILFWNRPTASIQKPTVALNPVPASLIVRSEVLPAEMIVRSGSELPMLRSSAFSVAVVKTLPAQELYKTISDKELLVILEGHPAILIHRGPGDAELVFTNPDDRNGFPVSQN